MYTAVNVQALNEKANGVKSLSHHASCVFILTRQPLSPSIWGGQPRKPLLKGKSQGPEVVCAALPSVTWSIQLLHPDNKLLVSIWSFPWGIAARVGSGCGDAKRKPTSQLSCLWLTFPTSAPVIGPKDLPTRIWGAVAEPDPAATADCWGAWLGTLCECASPPFFGVWRRIPFPAFKSLYAPAAPAHVTPAPQVGN